MSRIKDLNEQMGVGPLDDDRHDPRERACRHCDGPHAACACPCRHVGHPTPAELDRSYRLGRAIVAAIRGDDDA